MMMLFCNSEATELKMRLNQAFSVQSSAGWDDELKEFCPTPFLYLFTCGSKLFIE